MTTWIKQLDELLRGERVRGELLAQGRVDVRLRTFIPVAIILGGAYGFFMGWYALFRGGDAASMQVVASTVKLPALFLLTLGVTFPSLYVFNAIVGCKMTFGATARVLVAAIAVNLAVAASLGPILAFFTVSTTSYPFMIVLNVALLGVAGLVSVGFLFRGLRGLAHAQATREVDESIAREPRVEPVPPTLPEYAMHRVPTAESKGGYVVPPPTVEQMRAMAASRAASEREQAIARRRTTADLILLIWIGIYALVGSQMGWVLRPFIGNPDSPFTWFRERDGSFFAAVAGSLSRLLGL
jgi:hypothetical protein